jgi:hypothetical protein
MPKNKPQKRTIKIYQTPILNKIARKLIKEPRKFEHIEKLNTQNTQQKEIIHKNQSTLFPGIEFNQKLEPIKIKGPLRLYELKYIVQKRCNIELRSPRTQRAYKRYGSIKHIQKQLSEEIHSKTFIRRKNEYPYNLQPNLEHCIIWVKGYTWEQLEELNYRRKLPYTIKAAFYWINDSKFRTVTTIPHYHVIYDKHETK